MGEVMKKISPEVKSFLEWLSANKVENLFSEETVTLIRSKTSKAITLDKEAQIRADRLFAQLPTGIYVSPKEVIDLIQSSVKSIMTDSLNYSPMTLNFKEFSSCKVMKYFQGNIITGREKEIDTILLTLSKKSKRGSILIGDPGTGKTAIVQAINARLIERTVPKQLIGCYILNMDIPYILSKHKDDPVGTIINILEKASEYDKAILFIDEIHQLLGHRMNDILKPYLTEKIRFIGSTTINEYHTIITEDTALERRFTIVHVQEPNVEESTKMIIGTKAVYEEHHKCSIPDDICKYLVEIGSRFLGHRRNPDKSLDILDIACSIMYESEIKDIHDKENKNGEHLHDIDIKRKELSTLRAHPGKRVLTNKYVNLAIASLTGVSYDEISMSTNYEGVLKAIKEEVFGQDKQLTQLSNVVNIFKSTKYDRVRPISVLLMVGPPGSGKRTSAQLIAKRLFGSKNYFIDYDMSGFKDAFAITELKGAPPGYVGYAKSGGLIKAVRNNPLSVVFFRGINNAHETIRKYLVDGCRTGKMTDSAEREAKLNNTIIIFSITLDTDSFNKLIKGSGKSMGFGKVNEEEEKLPKKALTDIVGQDIISICDDILIYNELKAEDLEKIYKANLESYLGMYNVDVDRTELHKLVMENSKNGHDVVSKLSSEVPRLVFKQLSYKEKENDKVKVPKINRKNDRSSTQ
jgi:ATP-dependent Clp protease ATP-binding subunit ClpC